MIVSFRIPVRVSHDTEVFLCPTASLDLPNGRTVTMEIIGHFVNSDGSIDVEVSCEDNEAAELIAPRLPEWFSSIYSGP